MGKGSGAEWEGREGLSIRRYRIPKELSRGWSAAGIQEFASVPKQARRCIGRLEQWRKRSSCCQGSGQVAHGPKCAKIWKGGENSKDDDRFITRTNGVLSVVSQKHREGAERDVASSPAMSQFGWQDVFRVSPQPQHFALEVFAGTARICSALQRRGLKCYPIDICLFPSHNVLDIHIEHILVHWLQSGRVNFIWFGMPCTSFSQARKHDGVGPGPLRDYDHLWGLPGLSRNDRQKVFSGNQLLRFTIRLLTLCEQFGIPYALENPYLDHVETKNFWFCRKTEKKLVKPKKKAKNQFLKNQLWKSYEHVIFGKFREVTIYYASMDAFGQSLFSKFIYFGRRTQDILSAKKGTILHARKWQVPMSENQRFQPRVCIQQELKHI